MFFSRILVCLTFTLMTCSSLGLAQRSEPASSSSIGGQIVVPVNAGLKEPVLVLLDHSDSKNDQRTFTDLRGNFEFRNVPQGPYKAPTRPLQHSRSLARLRTRELSGRYSRDTIRF